MLLWPFNKYPGTDYETFNWEWLINLGKKIEAWATNIMEYLTRAETAADDAEAAAAIAEAAKNTILSRYYTTPQAYGAVGDGITDDTAAIQEMFDDTDAPVYFPQGTYLVTSGIIDNETDRPIYMDGSIVYNGAGAAITTNNKYNVLIVIDIESTVSDFTNGSIGARLINCNNCTIIIKKAKGFEEGVVYEGNNGGFAYNKSWVILLLNNYVGLHCKSVGTGWVNENQYYGGRFSVDSSKTWKNQATGIWLDGSQAHIANNNTYNEPSIENLGIGVKLYQAYYNKVERARFEGTLQPVQVDSSQANKITCAYGIDDNYVYDLSVNIIEGRLPTNIDDGIVNTVSTGSLIGKVANNNSYAVAEGVVGLSGGELVNFIYGASIGPLNALLLPPTRMCGMLCEIDPVDLYMVSIKNSNTVRYAFRMFDENDNLIDQAPITLGSTLTRIPSGDNAGGYMAGSNMDGAGMYVRFPSTTRKVMVVAYAIGNETEVTEIIIRSTGANIRNVTPNEMQLRGGAPTSTGKPGQIIVTATGVCYIYDGTAWKTITTS